MAWKAVFEKIWWYCNKSTWELDCYRNLKALEFERVLQRGIFSKGIKVRQRRALFNWRGLFCKRFEKNRKYLIGHHRSNRPKFRFLVKKNSIKPHVSHMRSLNRDSILKQFKNFPAEMVQIRSFRRIENSLAQTVRWDRGRPKSMQRKQSKNNLKKIMSTHMRWLHNQRQIRINNFDGQKYRLR